MIDTIQMRWSERGDAAELARLHGDAWRYAYRGIIPGVCLERLIAGHGAAAWQRLHDKGKRALLLEFDDKVAGYAWFGPCRMRGAGRLGEIYELYLRPEFHGAGFGRELFAEARRRLSARGLRSVVVWALAENEIACRFYSALGGRIKARTHECIGGTKLEKIAYLWR